MTNLQESELEKALRLAAGSPSHRPAFYGQLLDSSIYILSAPDGSPVGMRTLEAGEQISVLNWVRNDGAPIIPFFTSLNTLRETIEAESTFTEIPARTLFEMTKGSSLVLNPKSPYGKEFHPGEIEALLSDGVNYLPEERITAKETNVLLGQPANYPFKMADSLAAFFAKRSSVKTAYLALMQDPSQDETPHLLIGIEADRDFEQIIREAGVVAGDSTPDGEPIDLIRVERHHSGLSEYFIQEVKPFYKRNWAGTVRSLFGAGRT